MPAESEPLRANRLPREVTIGVIRQAALELLLEEREVPTISQLTERTSWRLLPQRGRGLDTNTIHSIFKYDTNSRTADTERILTWAFLPHVVEKAVILDGSLLTNGETPTTVIDTTQLAAFERPIEQRLAEMDAEQLHELIGKASMELYQRSQQP